MKHILGFVAALAIASPLLAAEERYSVLFSGRTVGTLVADEANGTTSIVYDYKNNGRGPTVNESVTVDSAGLPTRWKVTGSTTFGSKIDESFTTDGKRASWTDATGPGSADVTVPSLYVAQGASPFALGLYARALDKAGGKLPALPGGELKLEALAPVQMGTVSTTAYTLSGIDLDRQTIFLDSNKRLVAFATPEFILVRQGLEGEEARLRAMVAEWDTKRLTDTVRELAKKPAGNLRITNVRIFDPAKLALSAPASVLVKGNRIAAIEGPTVTRPRETVVDGAGGTILAGFNEMHAHLGQSDALMNLVAGITTVRDMGNDDPVLDKLVGRIESGELAGPRVVRSAFIEGKSKTNAQATVVVDNEADAVQAVRNAAKAGVFHQIKIYTSINPDWVPAMVKEAHALGLQVAGHVPAFTTTDAMIEAGYDEITHSNQLMLNWVLQPGDDTRTLLRISALKRFADYDINSPAAQKTINLMISKHIAHDPTLIIMETATRGRKGQLPPGAVDWAPHMPIGIQRDLKQPMLDITTPEDDRAYSAAFDTTLAVMKKLNDGGVLIVPGTDMGGSFWYHRELELYTNFLSNAQVLKRATLDSSVHLKRGADYGDVKPGKMADFMLLPGDPVADIKAIKAISMVVKDGTVYFPAQAYEALGIKPFAAAPNVGGAGFKPVN